MNKIKAFFKWIGNYWQQWIGLLGTYLGCAYAYYCIVMDKLNFLFEDYIPQENVVAIIIAKCVIGLLVGLGVILVTRNQCKWVGVGTNEKAKSYKEHLEELTNVAIEKMSDSTRKAFESEIKRNKELLKPVQRDFDKLMVNFEAVKIQLKNAQEVYDTVQNDVTRERLDSFTKQYNQLCENLNVLQAQISVYSDTIARLEKKIEEATNKKTLGLENNL